MATMNISLPDAMKASIDAEVASGRYATVSDYMRELVRDRLAEREQLAALDAAIADARASAPSQRTVEDIIAAERARVARAA